MLFSARSHVLHQALSTVAQWAVRREASPLESCVRVVASVARQTVELTAGDMMHSLTRSIPASVTADGSVAISAKEVVAATKVLPDGDATVATNERNWTTFRCGRLEIEVAGYPGADYYAPDAPLAGSAHYPISGALLARIVNGALYAVCADEGKPSACQLVIEVDDDGIETLATDGHRAAVCGIPSADGFGYRGRLQLIRAGAIRLAKMAAHAQEWDVEVGKDSRSNKKLLRLRADGDTVTLMQHSMEPPPTRLVLSMARSTGSVTVQRDELAAVVEVMKVRLPTSAAVRITVGPEGLVGVATSRESGSARSSCATQDFDGEPGDWWVHGLHLADAVSALGGNERIKISWGRVARGKEFDPVVLSSLDGSERHLIAGMDPNESASKA